jgi:hypothetical protein
MITPGFHPARTAFISRTAFQDRDRLSRHHGRDGHPLDPGGLSNAPFLFEMLGLGFKLMMAEPLPVWYNLTPQPQ